MAAMNEPVVIVGCTASGKSELAEGIAERVGGERGAAIMAVDSMQVYRGMDIGTAKPDAATRGRIQHMMIDVADPWEAYSAARFAQEARPYLYLEGGQKIFLVGGTILYLRALLEGLFEGPSADAGMRTELEAEAGRIGVGGLHERLRAVDAVAAGRIHPNDLRRIVRALEVWQITGQPISELQTQWNKDHPAIQVKMIGVRREKEELNRRINARVKAMLYPPTGGPGLEDEVRRLKDDPRGLSKEAASGVGYRQMLDYFAGKISLDEAVEAIKIQTRHLAKLQRTWLKRFTNVQWIDAHEGQASGELVDQAMRMLEP